LREQLEQSPTLLEHGPDYVLHGILDFVVDGYLPMVEKQEDRVLEMEKHMLISFLERGQIRRLFRMRREVVLFQRGLGPMSEMIGRMTHLELPCIDDNARPNFRDVHDDVKTGRGNGVRRARGGDVRFRGQQSA
jgi:magnesium transporter